MDVNSSDNKSFQRACNPKCLKSLERCQSDLTKVHKIENFFYASDCKNLKKLSLALGNNAFVFPNPISEGVSEEEQNWLLIAVIDLVPSLEALNSMTDLCDKTAYDCDCDYDGWGTEAVS